MHVDGLVKELADRLVRFPGLSIRAAGMMLRVHYGRHDIAVLDPRAAVLTMDVPRDIRGPLMRGDPRVRASADGVQIALIDRAGVRSAERLLRHRIGIEQHLGQYLDRSP